MKVLMVSKALVTGVYQKKLEELACMPDIELLAIVPPYWNEARVGALPLERLHTEGYQLVQSPMLFNGRHHIHFYPRIWQHIWRFRPDVVHIDEEPYNLVTFHITLLSKLVGAKVVFFTWQNLYRRYPPPFRFFERINYMLASAGIAGNEDAAHVLRRKGYHGSLAVIPQFGVDPDFYQPRELERDALPTIGFVGRLVPEKGVDDLLEAFARMRTRARLEIVGNGAERARLEMTAANLGVRDRVRFRGGVAAASMPETYSTFDVLVIPSRSRANWKEQFGRVIIEAMACEVPVIGSDSGEIPNVIGDGGLVYPEGDIDALASCLDSFFTDDALRSQLRQRSRQRVLQEFTQARVAARCYEVYRSVVSRTSKRLRLRTARSR